MRSDSVGVERRRLPFTLVENVIIEDQELGAVDVLVYLALAKHADGEGVCWPSLPTLAKIARVHRSSVAHAIKHLEARGYLKRTPRFRPDGGVTSNAYRLMPLTSEKYPPVAQEAAPRRPGRRGLVAQDDANHIQSEQDSPKGEPQDHTDQLSPQLAPPPSAAQPEEQVLADLADVSGLVHDRRFREGARHLLAQGKTPEDLVKAVQAAVRDPQECGGLSFIADRFPRWARKARDQERQQQQAEKQETAAAERVERARTAEEERVRILAEQESEVGRQIVTAAIARLPWNRGEL